MTFQHHVETFGAYQAHVLELSGSNTRLKVVPEMGATLIDLTFEGNSVLEGYQTPEELAEGKWGKSAVLFPFPNRLRDGRYQWDGHTYQFPINNAATNNAIHGFVRHKAFVVKNIAVTDAYAQVDLAYLYDGHLAWYPFPCEVVVSFRLHAATAVTCTFSVTNQHTGTIPMGLGWHPYFHLTPSADNHQIWVAGADAEQVDIDDRMIPVGTTTPYPDFGQKKQVAEKVFDNCFLAQAADTYALVIAAGDKALSVEMAAAQFPYFQVFTPPHRQSIALEPMSCNVDVFNNNDGLIRLAPAATWTGAVTISLQ